MNEWVAGVLNSSDAVGIVSALLGVILVVLGLEPVRWERKFRRKYRTQTRLQEISGRTYAKRPILEIYQLTDSLALKKNVDDRETRLYLRVSSVSSLSEQEVESLLVLSKKWVNSVGTFAREAAESKLPLRSFLQSNHLGVIREGAIVMPVLLFAFVRDELSNQERIDAFWGMALIELAVWYNNMSKVQRKAVYAAMPNSSVLFGPILESGPHHFRFLFDIVDRFSCKMPLRRVRKRAAKRLAQKIEARMRSKGCSTSEDDHDRCNS